MSHNDIPRRRRGLIWLIFLLPGTAILWWQYYFPKDGDVWASARRKDHLGMQLLYSLAFWAALGRRPPLLPFAVNYCGGGILS
jgi:hypothetical protein